VVIYTHLAWNLLNYKQFCAYDDGGSPIAQQLDLTVKIYTRRRDAVLTNKCVTFLCSCSCTHFMTSLL
jgi:hypothetical protein